MAESLTCRFGKVITKLSLVTVLSPIPILGTGRHARAGYLHAFQLSQILLTLQTTCLTEATQVTAVGVELVLAQADGARSRFPKYSTYFFFCTRHAFISSGHWYLED